MRSAPCRSSPARWDPAYSSISAWCPSVGLAGDDRERLDVEVRREHLRRRGRGRDAAVAAVLDHGADDELRVLCRPVAAPPGLVLEAEIARQRDDLLGGAGL